MYNFFRLVRSLESKKKKGGVNSSEKEKKKLFTVENAWEASFLLPFRWRGVLNWGLRKVVHKNSKAVFFFFFFCTSTR